MAVISFVRHGQTEWNAVRKLQGKMDSPLTAEGVEQTGDLADAIAGITFNRIITSPLGRATETASILAGKSGIPIHLEPLISEMQFGDIESVEKERFKELHPQQFYNLWHEAHRYDPSAFGGESFQSVENRATQFLDSLRTLDDNEQVLVVSHGMMLKVIFGIIWGHSLELFWNDPVPLNTSITTVELKDDIFRITDFSNVDHLSNTETISYV